MVKRKANLKKKERDRLLAKRTIFVKKKLKDFKLLKTIVLETPQGKIKITQDDLQTIGNNVIVPITTQDTQMYLRNSCKKRKQYLREPNSQCGRYEETWMEWNANRTLGWSNGYEQKMKVKQIEKMVFEYYPRDLRYRVKYQVLWENDKRTLVHPRDLEEEDIVHFHESKMLQQTIITYVNA
jgi:hypothetical protein